MMVSFMVLLIAADIDVWLGNKQQPKGQPVIYHVHASFSNSLAMHTL